MARDGLQLNRDPGSATAAVDARVGGRPLSLASWILVIVLTSGAVLLWFAAGRGNGAALGVPLGALAGLLLVELRLRPTSVHISVTDTRIDIERRFRGHVVGRQSISRTPASRFELDQPSRFLGMALHPYRQIRLDGHRVGLPLHFWTRTGALCDEWNAVLSEAGS